MQLPDWMRDAIDEVVADVPSAELARAATELSAAYRAGDYRQTPMNNAARRTAYVALRLPATFAANWRVCEEVHMLAPDFLPRTLLDLGAGPGTASLAAVETWPEIDDLVRVEPDPALIAIGRRVAAQHGHPALLDGLWDQHEFPAANAKDASGGGARANSQPAASPTRSFDLVVASYVIGELPPAALPDFVRAAWSRVAGMLILIEPGTPRGFAGVLAARETLGALGAHIVAPCPRAEPHPCPMAQAGDWCHFAQRVERTSLHRMLKGADLGYEDEKFSYLVASRQPLATAPARIIRHPLQHKGHVELHLCTPAGLACVTVSRRQKERYRAARNSEWGDAFQI